MKALVVVALLLLGSTARGEEGGSVEFVDEAAAKARALVCIHLEPRKLTCMELSEFLRQLEQRTGRKVTPPTMKPPVEI